MTKLDWDRVRRERSLIAPADASHLAVGGDVWRSVGPPLEVPEWDGVVRWCATKDGARWGVQWRDQDSSPARIEAEIAFEALDLLERDHGLTFQRAGRSWQASLPWFTTFPPPPSRLLDRRGRPRWGARLDAQFRWWIWTPAATVPLDAVVWRIGYDREG